MCAFFTGLRSCPCKSEMSQWRTVLRRARRYLAYAQVPVQVHLIRTFESMGMADNLPFTFAPVRTAGAEGSGAEGAGAEGARAEGAGAEGAGAGEDDAEDKDGDGDEDEDEDEDEDQDDEGDDVLGVAFTLLHAVTQDAALDAEERARAAVLQAAVDVFFYSSRSEKSQPAKVVAQRLATVGNGAMAKVLLYAKHRDLGANYVPIADAKFELRVQVALYLLRAMPPAAQTLCESGRAAARAQVQLEVRCKQAVLYYWTRARRIRDAGLETTRRTREETDAREALDVAYSKLNDLGGSGSEHTAAGPL